MSTEDLYLKGILDIDMILECLTGLRIGASGETFEIGGLENIVVKDPVTRKPYIPGSSLKGAMRAHYELYSRKPINKVVSSSSEKPPIKIHMCNDGDCEICRVFGRTPEHIQLNEKGDPDMVYTTRLKVDDGYPTEETEKEIWNIYCSDGVEIKSENVLDRLTSKAMPRQVERVPAKSKFNIRMSYKIFDKKDVENVKVIFQALKLVEDDYLGGYGSRGYGRVRFKNITLTLKTREYYDKCDDNMKILLNLNGSPFSSLEEVF